MKKNKGGRPPKPLHLPVVELPSGSRPQQSTLLSDETVDGKRKIYCRRYESCLSYAMKMNWASFDCLECPVDETLTKKEILG